MKIRLFGCFSARRMSVTLSIRVVLGVLAVIPPVRTAVAQDMRAPEVKAAAFLEQTWRASGVPSVTVSLAIEGELVFSRSLGYADLEHLVPATPSTVYNIGSVSKVITAVAVMQLVEEGSVRLDDPVQRFVPQFPDKGKPVTIRQLMTHTSGVRHYRSDDRLTPNGPYESFDEALAIFKDDPLRFDPGSFYLYSSFGVNLLQGVIESTSGMSFESYLARRVWGPAGMLGAGLDIPTRIVLGRARGYSRVNGMWANSPYEDVTYKFASGGMLASVEDLVRFGVALNHGRLLEPATVRQMLEPQFESLRRFDDDGRGEPITRWQQALLWRVRDDEAGRSFAYHCGTVKGFNACVVDFVDEDIVVAIANNAEAIGFRPALGIADMFRQASEEQE